MSDAKAAKRAAVAAAKIKRQVVLAQVVYPSATAACRAVQQLIRETHPKESNRLTPNDKGYELLLAVAERHKRGKWLTMSGIDAFVCQPNMTVTVIRHNGTEAEFSWRAAVMQSYPDKLVQAMRNAILPQISGYKKEHFEKEQKCSNPTCHNPDTVLGWKDVHIDHIVPFEKLRADFVATVPKKKIPSTRQLTIAPNNDFYKKSSPIFKPDVPFAAQWEKYHQEHATLRIVCKKCNLSLLRKKTVE